MSYRGYARRDLKRPHVHAHGHVHVHGVCSRLRVCVAVGSANEGGHETRSQLWVALGAVAPHVCSVLEFGPVRHW